MPLLSMRIVLKLFLPLIFLILICWILVDFGQNFEANRCAMSYIAHKPMAQSLPVPGMQDLSSTSYHLYKYCSGLCKPSAAANGFPVLFLPGTRGPYRAVRSMASAQDYFRFSLEFYFDFFVADFAEDATGLSGKLIEHQSAFLRDAVDAVLNSYAGTDNPPHSVLVVAHSMGIQTMLHLLSDASFDKEKVITVISLAGPILEPILSPGPAMDRVYARVRFGLERIASDPQHPLVLISITGGSRDLLVPDILGHTSKYLPMSRTLWLSTSAISNVWASCDHLCILWCRQLIFQLVGSFNDLRLLPPEISSDPTARLQVFRNRLLVPPLRMVDASIVRNPRKSSAFVRRSNSVDCLLLTNREDIFEDFRVPPHGLCIKLGPFLPHDDSHVLVMARQFTQRPFIIPVDESPWLFLCKNSLSCSNVLPISDHGLTTRIPAMGSFEPHRVALLSRQRLFNMGFNYIDESDGGMYLLIAFQQSVYPDTILSLMLEVFNNYSSREYRLPFIPVRWTLFHRPVSIPLAITSPNGTCALFQRVIFPSDRFSFSPSLPAPRMTIHVSGCSPRFGLVGTLGWYTPWNEHSYFSFLDPSKVNVVDLEVTSSSISGNSNQSAFVDFFLNRLCSYTVTIEYSILQWTEKLFRMHWSHLAGLICAHLLLRILLLLAQWKHFTTIAPTLPRISTLTREKSTRAFRHLERSSPVAEHSNTDSHSKQVELSPTPQRIPEPTCLKHQWHWHFGAAILHSLSFHFLPMLTSDWTHFHKLDRLGLRYGQQVPANTQMSSDFRILSHCALFIISLSVAALVPCFIDFGCLLSCWATNVFSCIHKLIYSTGSSLSLGRFRRNAMRITLLTFGIGILFSEALGILLLAAQILYKVHLLLSVDGILTDHESGEYSRSSVEHSVSVRYHSFRFHRLMALSFVLLSLLLTENWVSLYSRTRQYLNTGFLAIHVLFRPLPDPLDASVLLMFFLLSVMTFFIGPWPSKSLAQQRVSQTHSRDTFLFIGSVFALSLCISLLMHTALQSFSLFTFSVVGLFLFTSGLSTYQRSILGIFVHLVNNKQH